MLDDFPISDKTATAIFGKLQRTLQALGLNVNNLVAYEADNACVNYEQLCSVLTKLAEQSLTIQKQIVFVIFRIIV